MKKQKKSKTATAPRRMTGKACLYRGKVRLSRHYTMTREGHVLLDRMRALRGRDLSIGDVFESLLRQFAFAVDLTKPYPVPEL